MQLSAEDYESLIQSLRPYPTFGDERRKTPRAETRAQVTVIPLSGNDAPKPVSVGVYDVSRQGIGIVHSTALDLGRQFLLCLSYSSDVSTTRMVVCVIRRIEQTPQGEFRMGCEFAETMHPEVPTDDIARGLEKFQAKLFESDARAVEEGETGTDASKPLRFPQRILSLLRRKSA